MKMNIPIQICVRMFGNIDWEATSIRAGRNALHPMLCQYSCMRLVFHLNSVCNLLYVRLFCVRSFFFFLVQIKSLHFHNDEVWIVFGKYVSWNSMLGTFSSCEILWMVTNISFYCTWIVKLHLVYVFLFSFSLTKNPRNLNVSITWHNVHYCMQPFHQEIDACNFNKINAYTCALKLCTTDICLVINREWTEKNAMYNFIIVVVVLL